MTIPGQSEGLLSPVDLPTLADVLPAAAGLLGVDGFANVARRLFAQEGSDDTPAAVTVLLVDGLGWWPWQENLARTPTLAAMYATRMATTVPSTTPTALASLGTGLLPGAHGIVGAAFRVPEEQRILHPLSWGGDPHPQAIQPEPTVFERVARAGIPVLRVGASAYAASGLTRAVLRGGNYAPADTPDDIVTAIAGHREGLAYAYIPDLDRLGHVHGTHSVEWRDCLAGVDRIVSQVLDSIGPDHRLIVTADHGMVDCPPSARVVMEGLPRAECVTEVAGEPRLRHVYVAAGMVEIVRSAWLDALGDKAWVLRREEFTASGLLGDVEPDYAERVGDLVVLARDDTVLASEVDALVSGLLGQHGSVSDVEMHIPLLHGQGIGHG